jgi:hypothetical protein
MYLSLYQGTVLSNSNFEIKGGLGPGVIVLNDGGL